MAYNKFTIDSVKKNFGIKILGNVILFEPIKPIKPSDILEKYLERYLPLASAIGTEKARSEFIVAPILAEITELTNHSVSLFSGVEFNIDEGKGLNGRCDFIISGSSVQYNLECPILIVVAAKNDNINSGLGQCMAEMVAAQIFNQNGGLNQTSVYGSVTTGSVWRFIKLQYNQTYIDKKNILLIN